jgi:hypothetical protein
MNVPLRPNYGEVQKVYCLQKNTMCLLHMRELHSETFFTKQNNGSVQLPKNDLY